jgi:Bacterial membrane protein YfhO
MSQQAAPTQTEHVPQRALCKGVRRPFAISSPTRQNHLLARVLPYLLLLAEVLLFFRHVLFYGGYVIPWDLRYDHYPIAAFVAESFERGELPLWDPYTYCGRPLYANIQAQVFYPPMIAVALLSNAIGGDHLLYLLEWQLILHVFLGGVFCFLLLRRLGVSRPAALAGATIYQLGGFFASQAQHLGAVDAAAWLAFTWLCVVHLREKVTPRWTALLAAGFAMTVLAGLPSMSAVVFASACLLALGLAAFRLAPWKLPAAVVGAGIGSLPLAAVQLLPTIELTWNSVAQYRDAWLGSGGGLPLESLVSLLIPNHYGIFDLSTYSLPYDPTFLYIYGSYVGLALCIGAAVRPRRRETTLFAVFTLVCALWMLGDSTPIGAALFAVLPGFIQIGLHPEFALAAFALAFAVLAGLGFEQFVRKPALAYAVVAVIAIDLTAVSSGRLMNAFPTAREPGVTRNHFDGSVELLSGMRKLVAGRTPPWRIDTAGDSLSWAMAAPLTKVPSANGNDPFAPARLIQARLAFCDGERWGRYYEVSNLASPVLDLMNVRYVLARKPLDPAAAARAGFLHTASLPGHEVYENPRALPRFLLVSRIRKAANLEQAAEWLRSPGFSPASEAIVEGDIEFASSAADTPSGSVTVKQYSARRIVLEVDSPSPAFLVASETHYPGWQASLDGEPTHLFVTDVAFRGVPVPAGNHEVVLDFAPAILWWSAALSLVAWLLWGVAWWKRP